MADGPSRHVRKIPEATVARLPALPAQPARGRRATARRRSRPSASPSWPASTPPRSARTSRYLGSYGTRGVGYDVEYLLFQMSRELGLTQDWPVVIVGVGNLGHALANYGGLRRPRLPGGRAGRRRPARRSARVIGGITVAPHRRPARPSRPSDGIAIGIIATPAHAAQDVADRLVAAGVTSILNFAPTVVIGAGRGLAAQGRPGRRAADPQLLPAAPGRRRRRPPG